MNVIGLSPFGGFELYHRSLRTLADLCSDVIIRMDLRRGLPLSELPKGPKWHLFPAKQKWDRGGYHEELLREVDNLGLQPDVIVALDDDESFNDDETAKRDCARLVAGEGWQCWFGYGKMPNWDFEDLPIYPLSPHVKAFRWRPGLSYLPYVGRDQVASLVGETSIIGEAKIAHWCCWTPELRRQHEAQIREIYAAEIAAGQPVLSECAT